MDKRVALVGGLGLGAGLMFLLDPVLGRRRRQLIEDKARSLAHEAEDRLEKKGRNVRNHARGLVAEARGRLREEAVGDRTLLERVRAELGRATRHARAIDVTAADGVVTLIGPVLAAEEEPVLAAARRVRGVREVVDGLEAHETAEGVPSLQGEGDASRGGEGAVNPRPAGSPLHTM